MNSIVAGAIFDFVAWLSLRTTPIAIGRGIDCAPLPELIKEWATERGLDIEHTDVQHWQDRMRESMLPITNTDGTQMVCYAMSGGAWPPQVLSVQVTTKDMRVIQEDYVSADHLETQMANDAERLNDQNWVRNRLIGRPC